MATSILEAIRAKARSRMADHKVRIALGDTSDTRILQAARTATDDNIATIVLIGDAAILERDAKRAGISLDGIDTVSPTNFPNIEQLASFYFERRREKLRSLNEAETELLSNDLLFGAALVASGFADGMVAGSISTTSDVLRAALKGIGLADGVSVLSSMFLLVFSKIPGIREQEFSLAFADAAVVPNPTAPQLADIAIGAAGTYRALTGNEPIVAMLSFSTHGSAHSLSTQKMMEATTLARTKAASSATVPALLIDGELQFDAAFVPDVAARKAKDSSIGGRANVFIFPDLDAGNIGYKIAERLGMAQAIGPVLLGLRRPMNDLSRGASVSDIVNMIAITVLQGVSQ